MVYAEWVLIENFLADGILLYITGRLWGHPPPLGRLLSAAALGALGALAAVLAPDRMGGWIMKAALPALMALVAWPLSRKQLLSLTGTLMGTGLLAGGAALTLALQHQGPQMPAWAATLAGLMTTLLISAWTLVPRQLRPFRRAIACQAHGIRFYGHVDTGNAMREPISACPVLLVSPALAEQLFGEEAQYLRAEAVHEGVRLVPCRTLHGSGVLPALPLEELTVHVQGRWLGCGRVYAVLGGTWMQDGQEAILPPLIPLEGGYRDDELAAGSIRKMGTLAGALQRSAGLHRRKRYAAPPAAAPGGARSHRSADAGRQSRTGSAH